MAINRRDFMKGMFASTALFACGSPSWAVAGPPTRRAGRCILLLGGTGVDAAFETGVRAACVKAGYEGLQAVGLEGGLLADPVRFLGLMEQSRVVRWIAVMDDAAAVVFHELARTGGARLLTAGAHACSEDGSFPLRHEWLAASPNQSAGQILASRLVEGPDSFLITESFLREPSPAGSPTGRSEPGFSSYQLADADTVHLHCSGLSLPDGCRALGTSPEEWTPIPPRGRQGEAVTWRSDDWVESVGYAVAASAFGESTELESCSSRAFVHRTGGPERALATQRFASFVVDL